MRSLSVALHLPAQNQRGNRSHVEKFKRGFYVKAKNSRFHTTNQKVLQLALAEKQAQTPGMTQALEEQIAHLTRTVEELSDVVAKQDNELRAISEIVEALAQRTRTREADGGGGIVLGDERPPHY